jgi:hypothetical protein
MAQKKVVRYYDVQGQWRKVRPHLTDAAIRETLRKDFGKFTVSRGGRFFEEGTVPAAYDSCDWRWDRRGRQPAFWNYVCHSACHWLVNLNLKLAQKAEPKREWRILTSDKHSTVFDGVDTLFDMNFSALGVKAEETYELVTKRKYGGRSLSVGGERKTYYFGPLVPSIAEGALRTLKGHPDYHTYLSVCWEAAAEGKVDRGHYSEGITKVELVNILNKLTKEWGTK